MGDSPLEMCRGLNYKLKPYVPTISDMPPQTMVTVVVKGDPSKETGRCMPPLYATAYAIRIIYKEAGDVFKVEKLRARWPDNTINLPKEQWTGTYALPVPNDIKELPDIKEEKKVHCVEIKLTTWEYGKVGQIIHQGPYSEEAPTVQKLHDYVQSEGFKLIANSHEEIYLSDPTKSSPDKIKTLIVCRIK